MKAEELMIGDWVCYRGTNIVVTSIYNKGGSNEVGWSEKESVWVNGSNVEPIPLTPEILEKNGFVDEMSNYAYRTDNYHVCYYCADERLSINKYGAILDVRCFYVHQLQHALRLCGIEKEMVL